MNPSADILKTMVEMEADTTSKPAESLEHITAYDVEKLYSEITYGGRVYLKLIIILFHSISLMIHMDSYLIPDFLNFYQTVYFQGLTLIELATHLKEKAAKLKCEGLGKIKITLAGCNTSSLLDTLEGAFGSIDQEETSTTSISEIKQTTK